MKTFLLCALLLIFQNPLFAQEDLELSADEFPRVPATEPADVFDTFEIAPGFSLKLAAHEPAVMDPIAMTFDEHGRAYVVEMRGYSERRNEELGQIRLLTDTNGDGIFDQSSVFKKGLRWPTAVICYKGGIFVGATPDVFYFKDTDGDGICDEEKTVFTGFGEGAPKLNMQALFNSFRWGPDNRIWGATARNGGTITRPGDSSFEPVNVRGADFSFDPETLDFRAENGTAQYGMSFDDRGRRFICSNSQHILWVAYERSQVKPNPWFSLPSPLVNIPDDGAAAPVYRISPDEPWRIVRTRWRVAGVVKGVVEGGGRVSGYFTSATGVHLYWGNAFGPEFRNNAFIGDVGSNLVHRKIVKQKDGSVGLMATRPDPDEKTEFLRSRDNWFRPTSFTTGPDGCLYITDMYRETIEHPWSLPEPIKKHVDLNSGFERGRIYRVEPDQFPYPKIDSLANATDDELEGLLTHDNDWHRTTARRLLFERGKPAQPIAPTSPFPALLASGEPLLDKMDKAKNDPWMEASILNSLRTIEALREAWNLTRNSDHDSFTGKLLTMAGRSGDAGLLAEVGRDLGSRPLDSSFIGKASALLTGAGYGGKSVASLTESSAWKPLLEEASRCLADASQPLSKRKSAIEALSLLGGKEGQDQLQSILTSGESDDIAGLLITAIRDIPFLVQSYETIPSAARAELANRIGSNATASLQFLQRIQKEEIALVDAPASLIEQFRSHKTEAVRALAGEVLPAIASRSDVIQNYQDALTLETDRKRGEAAFTKGCVACHVSHEGLGIELGPAIATFATAGKESLLERILDPNREVAPQYQTYVFDLQDGTSLSGIILQESPEEVTVRMPGGIDKSFPRTAVQSMKGLGQSLMPEGLEATLSVQEMADLLAYLSSPAK
ncbi:MAG: c-type cytochrome [Verrucomicrobiales bacterium]|nr:c-type cytochrome [Verrucomicrobiales bacterium]